MTDSLIFFLACFGATSIVKMMSTEIERMNRKPFNCPLCSGFWISMILFFVWKMLPFQSAPLLYSFAGAGICWGLYKIISWRD